MGLHTADVSSIPSRAKAAEVISKGILWPLVLLWELARSYAAWWEHVRLERELRQIQRESIPRAWVQKTQ